MWFSREVVRRLVLGLGSVLGRGEGLHLVVVEGLEFSLFYILYSFWDGCIMHSGGLMVKVYPLWGGFAIIRVLQLKINSLIDTYGEVVLTILFTKCRDRDTRTCIVLIKNSVS